ncbi:SMI1/KNR4 family protein [Nitratireductor sp. ZSWI3]|uniref:SMI1/KNR4 family protein n=1 Tax=Nitratireductor sp. ZSWI3 TaxID=2966359 RepID=UPI0021503F59|nr:SMI1/KNR4 family protein [Nitratireductor sp. ZSWI3]MCR4265794.1 SMI1/KNR4 family protein [Nitratireductor sp. ZSWI3]
MISRLPYEKNPYAPFQYETETIEELEALTGIGFPEDFRWYLSNVGWLDIRDRQGFILVADGDYLSALEFTAADNAVFAASNYRNFVKGREGDTLPGTSADYFPFAQIKGGNPYVTMRLLVALGDDDRGSIWAVHTIGHFDTHDTRPPVRLADDLSGFLAQLGAETELTQIADKNNDALFDRLLAAYQVDPPIEPTLAGNPVSLLNTFFEAPASFVFDGGRNVEFQYRCYAQGVANAEAFARKAEAFARPEKDPAGLFPRPLNRRDIRFREPEAFGFPLRFEKRDNGFRVLTVQSRVGDDHALSEVFLLHEDGGNWTLLRRHNAVIDEVRIKGVGTFAFDATYKWKLKKKMIPAWSERPAVWHVDGNEDALDAARIAFIKEVVDCSDFKAAFEVYVFQLYTKRRHHEFEAMTEDEKREWADSYPEITLPADIWRLLGKTLQIHIEENGRFHLRTDATWDPEHGLDIAVEDWRIRER